MKRVVVTGLGASRCSASVSPRYGKDCSPDAPASVASSISTPRILPSRSPPKFPTSTPKRSWIPNRFAAWTASRISRSPAPGRPRGRKLEISDENRDRVAVVMNTGGGGIPTIESNVTAMAVHGPSRVGPLVIPMFAPNMASSQVSIAWHPGTHDHLRGGLRLRRAGVRRCGPPVQAGEADIAVTGAQAGITPVALTSLANMHSVTAKRRSGRRVTAVRSRA